MKFPNGGPKYAYGEILQAQLALKIVEPKSET